MHCPGRFNSFSEQAVKGSHHSGSIGSADRSPVGFAKDEVESPPGRFVHILHTPPPIPRPFKAESPPVFGFSAYADNFCHYISIPAVFCAQQAQDFQGHILEEKCAPSERKSFEDGFVVHNGKNFIPMNRPVRALTADGVRLSEQ